jgi:hypothetical protein
MMMLARPHYSIISFIGLHRNAKSSRQTRLSEANHSGMGQRRRSVQDSLTHGVSIKYARKSKPSLMLTSLASAIIRITDGTRHDIISSASHKEKPSEQRVKNTIFAYAISGFLLMYSIY